MSAHRYWAFNAIGNPWVTMRELEMRGSIGGADLTGSGTYLGPVSVSIGSSAALFDNNAGTAYGTTGDSSGGVVILGCDFGSPVEIVEIVATTYVFSSDYGTREAWLGYSDDGINFTWLGPRINFSVADNTVITVNGFFEFAGGQVMLEPAHLGTDPPPGEPTARVAGIVRWNLDSGSLAIAGTVKIDDDPDIPVSRRVRLFEQASGRLVRETWSAADGTYLFDNLPDGKYFLVAHDHTLQDQAVAKDQITPQVPA